MIDDVGAGVFLKRDSGTSDASEPEAVKAVKKRAKGWSERRWWCSVSLFFSHRNSTKSDNSHTLALVVLISTV
jgi:hypothetical protein